MKKNILTKTLAVATTALAVGSVFFAISAKAEENYVTKYTCSNIDNSTLNVFQSDEASSKKAMVHLTVNGELKVYEAIYEQLPKPPFAMHAFEYQLFEKETKVGTVKVTTQKKFGRGGGFCGRAGCDFPPPATIPVFSTYASIQLGEYEDSFDCQ